MLKLIRRSVLCLKTMAALPVVFAKIFVIYIANLLANREIWNQSTPKGKRQFFLSLLLLISYPDLTLFYTDVGDLGTRLCRFLFAIACVAGVRKGWKREFGLEARQKSPFLSLSNAYHAGRHEHKVSK